jgi:hypothetical protein
MAPVWNYVFTDQPGCTYLQNTVTVSAPFYTRGDLCIKNSAAAVGPRVEAYGGIQLENTGRVGTARIQGAVYAVAGFQLQNAATMHGRSSRARSA